jgi:hypothetical protein
MSLFDTNQDPHKNFTGAGRADIRKLLPLVFEESVADGADFTPAYQVRTITVDVDGFVEYALPEVDHIRKTLFAGQVYVMAITKIWFTGATLGGTDIGLNIHVGR